MYEDISPEQLADWRSRGAQVVDVREPWEFAEGHVPGSINVPLSDFVARLPELTAPVVLVCAAGARSSAAAAYLDRQGFGPVANLLGGVHGWQDSDLEREMQPQ